MSCFRDKQTFLKEVFYISKQKTKQVGVSQEASENLQKAGRLNVLTRRRGDIPVARGELAGLHLGKVCIS